MKYLISLVFIFFFIHPDCTAQTKDEIVNAYIERNTSDFLIKMNHGPNDANFGDFKNAIVFFVSTVDEEQEGWVVYGVLYDPDMDVYSKFGIDHFDPGLGSGVISVFFENIDDDIDNEMIVLYEIGGRSFFASQGGYAGIKVWYETRVFDFIKVDEYSYIGEYEMLGKLLTVNLPILMGTQKEEELVYQGNDDNLIDLVGVTYNANQIKKRIKLLKSLGLLGNDNAN